MEGVVEQTGTPPTPAPSAREQYRNEVKQMAQAALDAGSAIIAENHLSKTPRGTNLAWVLTAEDSLAARCLKRAIDVRNIERYDRITVALKGVDTETSGLDAHGLTKLFVEKMGFSVPQTREEWQRQYDRKRNVVVFSDPSKPFTVEGIVNGTSKEGEPNLEGFSLVPKTLPPNVV